MVLNENISGLERRAINGWISQYLMLDDSSGVKSEFL